MDLNKEAEEYANKNVTKSLHAAYVEGATNSKYVQAEKIKAKIEVLKNIDVPMTGYVTTQIYSKIEELRKNLKELEIQ
jgi:hypothetical protein